MCVNVCVGIFEKNSPNNGDGNGSGTILLLFSSEKPDKNDPNGRCPCAQLFTFLVQTPNTNKNLLTLFKQRRSKKMARQVLLRNIQKTKHRYNVLAVMSISFLHGYSYSKSVSTIKSVVSTRRRKAFEFLSERFRKTKTYVNEKEE